MKVIICGGRDFADIKTARAFLDAVHAKIGITHVIEGGARGADRIGRLWAVDHGIPVTTVIAEWDLHKRRAGYLRNVKMAEQPGVKAVLALPGGAGTQMMVDIAHKKKIPVAKMPTEIC